MFPSVSSVPSQGRMPSRPDDPHMSTASSASNGGVPVNVVSNLTPTVKLPVTTTTNGKSDIQRRFEEICFKSPLPRSISQIYNSFQLPGSLAPPPPPVPPPPLFPSTAAQRPQTTAGPPNTSSIANLRRREPESDHSSEEPILTEVKNNAFLPHAAAIGPAKVTDEVGKCIGGFGGLRRSHSYYPTGTLALGIGIHMNEPKTTTESHPVLGHEITKNGECSLQVEDTRMEAQKTFKHIPASRMATSIATAIEYPTIIANALCVPDSTSATKRPIHQPDLAAGPVSPPRKSKDPIGELGRSQAKRRKLSQLQGAADTPATVVRGTKRCKEKLREKVNKERTETLVAKEGEGQGKGKDLMEETSPVLNSEQGQESEMTVMQEQQEGRTEEIEDEDGQGRDFEVWGVGSVTNGMVKEVSTTKKDQLPRLSSLSTVSQSRYTRRSLPTKLPSSTASRSLISPSSAELRGGARNVTPPSWVRSVRAKVKPASIQRPNARVLKSTPFSPENTTPRLRPTRGNKTPAKPLPTPKFSPMAKPPNSSSPERGSIIIEGGRRSSYRVSKTPREWWVVDAVPTVNTSFLTKLGNVEGRAQAGLVEQRGEKKTESMKGVATTRKRESEVRESLVEDKQAVGIRGKTSVGNVEMEIRQRSTSRGRSTIRVTRRQLQSLSASVPPTVQPHVQSRSHSPIAAFLPTSPEQGRKTKDFDLDGEAESQLQMELKHNRQGDNSLCSRSPLPLTNIPPTTTTKPKPIPKKPSTPLQARPKSILGRLCPQRPTTKGVRPTGASVIHGGNGVTTRRTRHEVEHADYEFSD